MIKLLIVDDEIKTREGLRDFISWSELKIDTVQIACDGAEGLEVALEFNPDIIITDIRMSRMNGIDFATKCRTFLPNCKIIFISGYSDKEYLKSAIHLRAISYVEKPINIDEVIAAVSEAVELHLEQVIQQSEIEHSNLVEEKTMNLIKEDCALGFIDMNSKTADIIKKISDSKIKFPLIGNYCTIVIKLKNNSNKLALEMVNFQYRYIIKSSVESVFKNYLMAPLDKNTYMLHISQEVLCGI